MRTREPASARDAVKKEAARQVKKQARRAAADTARVRLGLDREKASGKTNGKKAMYGVWMGRVREKQEEEKPPREVTPLYLCMGASYGMLAALQFREGVQTRKRVPYYRGLTYLAAAGVYVLLDCLNRTEKE